MPKEQIFLEIHLDNMDGKEDAPTTEEVFGYMGYQIVVGAVGDRWWARIDDLGVETMPSTTLQAAFADAAAFVDGFDPAVH